MSKSFIDEFKHDFSFLEEYGFVFTADPNNPNRPCYKNNYGEILYWIEPYSGCGFTTEIFYQINGWKYSIDIKEEYKKIFNKTALFKSKIRLFKELFEYLVSTTGKFYNLNINKTISKSLKDEEVTDLNIFKNNEALFNAREKAITNLSGIIALMIIYFIIVVGFLLTYEYSKSNELINIMKIIISVFVLVSQILIVILLKKNLNIISRLFLIIYAFVPLNLNLFFDRRFDFKCEIIICTILLVYLIINVIIFFIKKQNNYLLNGVIPCLYPLFLNMINTFILNEYLFFNDQLTGFFIIIGIVVGLILAFVCVGLLKKDMEKKQRVGLGFGVFFCTIVIFLIPNFIIQNINYAFDKSEGITYKYQIIDKETRFGGGRYGGTNYCLIIYKDGKEESLHVNKRVYNDFERYQIIELTKYEGYLNYSYFEYTEE